MKVKSFDRLIRYVKTIYHGFSHDMSHQEEDRMESSEAVMISLGCLGLVLVLAIVIICLLHCCGQKKRKRKRKEPEVPSQGTDQLIPPIFLYTEGISDPLYQADLIDKIKS